MDYLLKKFFEPERWEYAIETGVEKGIDRGILRKMSDPDFRIEIYRAIKNGNYKISPPHTAQIPKDEFEIIKRTEIVTKKKVKRQQPLWKL